MTFEVAPAASYPGKGYDLVTMFDCLHDMGDPAGAARHVRESLSADGTWMIVEPAAGDRVEENLNPVGRAYYGFSTLLCTPSSLSQPVGWRSALRPERPASGTSSRAPASAGSSGLPAHLSTWCSRRGLDLRRAIRSCRVPGNGAIAGPVPRQRGLRDARRGADLLRGVRGRRACGPPDADLVRRSLAMWKMQIPYLSRYAKVDHLRRAGERQVRPSERRRGLPGRRVRSRRGRCDGRHQKRRPRSSSPSPAGHSGRLCSRLTIPIESRRSSTSRRPSGSLRTAPNGAFSASTRSTTNTRAGRSTTGTTG